MKIEQQEVAAPVEVGDVDGVEGGVDGGDLDGVVPPPPPPPSPLPPPSTRPRPPPTRPLNVAPTALEANRIAGEKNIVPDSVTTAESRRSGKEKLVGTYKFCITAEGNISSVTQLKSTGFPAYDQKIQNTIRGEWRYRPFELNGKPAPVCTAVTFIFAVPRAPRAPARRR